VKEETECAAIIRAQKNIQHADMVLFVIDLSSRIDQNDLMIGQIVAQSTKPTIIVANKWDLIQEGQPDMLLKEIKERFNKLFFAPVVFCSAITGKGVFQIIDRAAAIFSKMNQKIRIAHLNQILKSILKEKKVFSIAKKSFQPKYVTLETQLPLFLRFYAKQPTRIKPDDELFLKKRILQELELEGVPVFFKIIPYKK
jgi:GTP-binding protein